MSTKKVLSIQSHVIYGHAGNSAAVFPMRRVGVEVWPLNTVQFSNHTQYPEGWKGRISSPEDLTDAISGIVNIRKLSECDAVLSGYIGSAGQGGAILGIVQSVKAANPGALYFCDPVMGHPVKGCKVAPGVAEFHRDHSIFKADIMAPNVMELGTLVGRELNSVGDCLEAAHELSGKGPKIILVKHLSYAADDPDSFEMLLAAADGEAWHIRRPLIDFKLQPVGVGDLTSALLLASLLKGMSNRDALEFTASAVYEVMLATKAVDSYELQLVVAQNAMVNPAHSFKATWL